MFYIVVSGQKVIVDSTGKPREFAKRKKAQNYIDGRQYLQNLEVVTNIDGISKRLRIDI
jgi:hypothetical protein